VARSAVADPTAVTARPKLLCFACGSRDDLRRISQGAHAYLKE
jgi:hypothetical protein